MDKNQKLTAIIIEDEQFAADNLSLTLHKTCPEVLIRGIYTNVPEAIAALKEFNPELLFIDVYLNGSATGLEVLDAFPDHDFKVIFTTAYEEYALSAFEYNAVQFLLKPFTDEKLAEAVNRAKIITLGEQRQIIKGLKITDDFIKERSDYFSFRNNKGEYTVRNCNDLLFLEAEGSMVTAFFNDKTTESSTNKPLNEYENILKYRGFIRISSKHIVNITFISKYKKPSKDCTSANLITNDKKEGAGGSVILKNGKSLPVSRQYCQDLKEILNII